MIQSPPGPEDNSTAVARSAWWLSEHAAAIKQQYAHKYKSYGIVLLLRDASVGHNPGKQLSAQPGFTIPPNLVARMSLGLRFACVPAVSCLLALSESLGCLLASVSPQGLFRMLSQRELLLIRFYRGGYCRYFMYFVIYLKVVDHCAVGAAL